jgi:hypothetical protein
MKQRLVLLLCVWSMALPGQAQELSDKPALAEMGVLKHFIVHLSGDLGYAQPIAGEADFGFGASFRMEGQFLEWLSIGIYFDPTFYGRDGDLLAVGPLGMMGRVIFHKEDKLSLFAIGGMGMNALVAANGLGRWPGNFHGFAGIGAQAPLDGPWSLDLSLTYQLHSPAQDALQAVSARIGLDRVIEL